MTMRVLSKIMLLVLAGGLAGGCAFLRVTESDPKVSPPVDPWADTDRYVPLSVDGLFNASATEGDTGFDGWGNAYPASLLMDGGGRWHHAGIPFRLPDFTRQPTNVVVAAGQVSRVLPPRSGSRLHFLAAAVNGNQETSIRLTYADGLDQVALRVSDWCGEPRFGEKVVGAWDRVGPRDHETATCRVFRVTVPVDAKRLLTAVGLPDHSDVRIFAITLER